MRSLLMYGLTDKEILHVPDKQESESQEQTPVEMCTVTWLGLSPQLTCAVGIGVLQKWRLSGVAFEELAFRSLSWCCCRTHYYPAVSLGVFCFYYQP